LGGAIAERSLNLIIAAHCHQPVGNLNEVANDACDRAYLPFLEVLASHPGLLINLHYSGSLLEWLEEQRRDVLDRVVACSDQIEWMGGAFYDPILPMIPAEDALAHISRLSEYLQDRFDQTPRGVWLAERVWDPSLPSLLRKASMEYTLLDDYAFLQAGYPPRLLTDSFITDHMGNTLTIFPIAQDLRYAIPWSDPEDVMALLRSRHDHDPQSLAVIADDGEKFGLWPRSSERVYAPGNWLEEFLARVEAADWLETTTFERYLDDRPAERKVAIPSASYREMSEWSLPPETIRLSTGPELDDEQPADWTHTEGLIRGGWWPNFLIHYPEAARLYRKMLRVSAHTAASRGATEARTELLRAQGNDPYWHGAFGGLYFPHLRAAAHRHLITAQTIIDAQHHRGRAWSYMRRLDWDADGREEVEVELPDQAWVVDPAEGGCLLYYDDKPSRWSIGDVVARRFEPYHAELAETQTYDRHPRRWLIDHVLPTTATVESFAGSAPGELLPLPETKYEIEEATEGRGSALIRLSGLGGKIQKRIEAEDRKLQIGYRIERLPEGRFGPELPVTVWEGAGEIRADGGSWQNIDQPLSLAGHRFRLRHNGINTYVLVALRQPGALFCAPIRTTVRGDAGFISILQGVVLWPHWSTTGEGHYEMTIEIGDIAPDAP
jgi:alpha-amylase